MCLCGIQWCVWVCVCVCLCVYVRSRTCSQINQPARTQVLGQRGRTHTIHTHMHALKRYTHPPTHPHTHTQSITHSSTPICEHARTQEGEKCKAFVAMESNAGGFVIIGPENVCVHLSRVLVWNLKSQTVCIRSSWVRRGKGGGGGGVDFCLRADPHQARPKPTPPTRTFRGCLTGVETVPKAPPRLALLSPAIWKP